MLLEVLRLRRLEEDVISYSSLASSIEKSGTWAESWLVLQEMQQTKVPCDATMQNSLISGQKSGEWVKAQLFLHRSTMGALRSDTISFNGLIQSMQRFGYWLQAHLTLQSLPQRFLAADVIGYSSAIQACEGSAEWQQASSLLRTLQERLLRADSKAYCATLGVLAEAGQWPEAFGYLKDLQEACTDSDVVVCNLSLAACGTLQMRQARRILSELHSRRLANTQTYNSVISLSVRRRDWLLSVRLLREMEDATIPPDGVTHSMLAEAFSEASKWVEAVHSMVCVAQQSQRDLGCL